MLLNSLVLMVAATVSGIDFDRIAAENHERPFVVTRAKWLVELFDQAEPLVATNAVFVDRFSDRFELRKRRELRRREFDLAMPERRDCADWLKGTEGAFVSRLDNSHTCPDWESVLKLGMPGLAQRARERMKSVANEKDRTFLECVVMVYEAAGRLLKRWSKAAEAVGNHEVAKVLAALSEREPRTLREALQMMIVYDSCQEAEGEDVRSQGLFDRLYIDYYRNDLAAGRETRESAKELVRAMYDVFYRQGHPNGKNIGFGGVDRSGKSVWNELTEIGFELHYELNRVNPKLTFRYSSKTPREQMLKVSRCIADGRTAIVFLNDDISYESFRRRGKAEEDIADAILIGCYEPGIMGKEVIASMSCWFNLAKPLEVAMKDTRVTDYAGFERAYFAALTNTIRIALDKTRLIERRWYELNPSPLFSGTFPDAIAKARDAYDGGCKYNQSGVMCGGLATVVDSLAAVRYLVDEKKAVTMAELRAVLAANWQGYDELRQRAMREAPKWGNNDDRADLLGKKMYDLVTAQVNATPNGHGGTYQAGFWSIDNDVAFGKWVAATADGRLCGTPLSRNNVATVGCGTGGPTALMNSCAKLDQAECPDGFILDLVLPASSRHDERTAERVADILAVFAKKGGHCVHMNCFDSSVLRDAMEHPDKYPDLQVRVCGWNVLWKNLSRHEQLHFLKTTEAQGM